MPTWFLPCAGYLFLVFSLGWWVGYLSARREARSERRIERRPDANAFSTYRTIGDLPRPNAGKPRTG